MSDLGEYIKQAMAKPFRWGEHDCCTFCAGWFGQKTGLDLIPDWGRAYRSDKEANKLIKIHGGLLAIFAEQADKVAKRYRHPKKGAIGILQFGRDRAGAIYSGERWMVFGENGIRAIPHKDGMAVAIWAI